MDMLFLEQIRQYELSLVLSFITPGTSVLDIGAGAGWQSKLLSTHGAFVEAIDLVTTSYKGLRVFPVKDYDGSKIPFPDNYFDIVFSSNVLEHVSKVEEFQEEIQRVLKDSGIAIHIVPSTSWRMWTIMGLYSQLFKVLVERMSKTTRKEKISSKVGSETSRISEKNTAPKKLHMLMTKASLLIPSVHGEKGNAFTELFLFSRTAWISLFKKSGWAVTNVFPSRLFYTGYLLLGSRLGLKARNALSYLFGSSSHIFVMTKKTPL